MEHTDERRGLRISHGGTHSNQTSGIGLGTPIRVVGGRLPPSSRPVPSPVQHVVSAAAAPDSRRHWIVSRQTMPGLS
ncbi:hypothetical protein CMUS01_09265 [Colletotrichum musicola]|uniref:Uncharacterized protein n=1 Tax=Colletotrichum musicola TaxID=2175873 RepID=A0A8H6K8S1_9PEZI|nr:hypothetical protein CMUS01_09265 [Colletotrichum musicola]